MRSRAAILTFVAGLVVAVAAVFLDPPLGEVVVVAAIALVPAAVVIELARRRQTHKTALIAALFACGLLMFVDESSVAVAAFFATVALLLATGFTEGHIRALWWAAAFLASAIVADVLWQLDFAPFDRDDQREPLPASLFVLIGLPVPMAIIALGVGARWLWRRVSGQPRPGAAGLPS
jgi:hypothetical protein